MGVDNATWIALLITLFDLIGLIAKISAVSRCEVLRRTTLLHGADERLRMGIVSSLGSWFWLLHSRVAIISGLAIKSCWMIESRAFYIMAQYKRSGKYRSAYQCIKDISIDIVCVLLDTRKSDRLENCTIVCVYDLVRSKHFRRLHFILLTYLQ